MIVWGVHTGAQITQLLTSSFMSRLASAVIYPAYSQCISSITCTDDVVCCGCYDYTVKMFQRSSWTLVHQIKFVHRNYVRFELEDDVGRCRVDSWVTRLSMHENHVYVGVYGKGVEAYDVISHARTAFWEHKDDIIAIIIGLYIYSIPMLFTLMINVLSEC